MDYRHPATETLQALWAEAEAAWAAIAARRRVAVSRETYWAFPRVAFDAALAGRLRETAARRGAKHRDMLSGAGHDAYHAASCMPAVMLFIPCHGGVSHHPTESISREWAEIGLRVLAEAVIETANLCRAPDMRIAIAGFQHESHSFAPLPTGWREFLRPGGFPGLQRAATMIETLRPTSVPTAGAIEVLEAAGAELVPLTWCFANPAGPVTAEAFERIAALMVAELSDALDRAPLDGIYLELHGAMVAVGYEDAEGELLRRIRAVVGPELPITVSLDPHANMTRQMVALADALVPYRTYPHVDMKPAGAQAARLLLERIRRGAPWARAFAELDFLIPLTMQCTLVPPMADVLAERARLEALHGCAELAFCFGFPYADFPGCGVAIAAYAATPEAAQLAVAGLKAWIDAREPDFAGGVAGAAEGVAEAIGLARGAAKPVVMADTQDNPGGGGHGDTTGLLAELIRQDAQGAVLGLINDAESAAACHAAGVGATLSLSLGGKSNGAPLPVTAVVEALTDGRFTGTGPMSKGNPADLGPTALIRVSSGVRVIVVTRKMQALDQALFTHIGVEPSAQKILALKSSVHFRAHFQPIAEKVIVVAAPGPVVADPAVLPFTRLRPGLRLRPGANR